MGSSNPQVDPAMWRNARSALAWVWKTERFGWPLTRLMHHFPGQSAFERQM